METATAYAQRCALDLQLSIGKIDEAGRAVDGLAFEGRERVFPYLERARVRLAITKECLEEMRVAGGGVQSLRLRREAESARHELRCAIEDVHALLDALTSVREQGRASSTPSAQ